jgi:hypothetical protein
MSFLNQNIQQPNKNFFFLSLATTAAKIFGVSSSGVFAGEVKLQEYFNFSSNHHFLIGYTLSLSHAAIPAIMVAPETVMLQQWRVQYLRGFMVKDPRFRSWL